LPLENIMNFKNIVEEIIHYMHQVQGRTLNSIDDREEQGMEIDQIQLELTSICDDNEISENGINQIRTVALNFGYCVKDIEIYLAQLELKRDVDFEANKKIEIEKAYELREQTI